MMIVDFNSFMVQLKETKTAVAGIVERFQFLYGTIKRKKAVATRRSYYKFQFLYGTIKS